MARNPINFSLRASTYVGVCLIVPLFVIISLPMVRFMPHGIFLPASATPPQVNPTHADQVTLYHLPFPPLNQIVLGHIHVETFYNKPDNLVRDITLAKAKSLASQRGGRAILVKGSGYSHPRSKDRSSLLDNKRYFVFGSAIIIPHKVKAS